MSEQFARTALLLGEDTVRHLEACRVAVFGVGGVGGFCVEALARSGIGALDLIDSDTVSLSNLNRQIIALHSTLGRLKVDVMADRIQDINPNCRVTRHPVFYLPETRDRFDFHDYDYVVDCIDTVKSKLALIEQAYEAGTPIICAMGAGNKLDPTRFEVADIYKTSVCPLAKVIRTECRKRGIPGLKVVYSRELPLKPGEDASEGKPGRPSPGSVAFVPSVAGLILAGEVIRDLAGIN